MSFQVALGGNRLASTGVTFFNDSPVYYEPGFSILTPLEIEVDECDSFYILIRKRNGDSFENLLISNLNVSIKDATKGIDIPFVLMTNTIHDIWNKDPSDFTPLVLRVDNGMDYDSPVTRVRIMDCYISDEIDNKFISFRITVNNNNGLFHYIPVYLNALYDRHNVSTPSREIYYITRSDTDGYILFSPYASLKEVNKNDKNISFSYPLNSIFYKKQETYNEENFTYTVSNVSQSFISESSCLINVPGFHKAAVLHIDSYMDTKIRELGNNVYMDIRVEGELSGITDTLRVNFIR